MKTSNISVKEAVSLIKTGNFDKNSAIDFNDEKIDAFDALLLGQNGIDVPENLIEYDDDKIDFSDIPEMTEAGFEEGRLVLIKTVNFPLPTHLKAWVENEKVDLEKLLPALLENFYAQTLLIKKQNI